jgi:SOS-response transcriptional repressor LexA
MGWRERLREAVEATGLSHSEIARRAGIADGTLSRILTAKMKPRFDTVARIAYACGETVGWVMEEPGFALSRRDLHQLEQTRIFLVRILALMPKADARAHPNAIHEYGDIPQRFRLEGARVIYRAVGDSMEGAAILAGDLLYVRPETLLKNAQDCIAVMTIGEQHFAKRLRLLADTVVLESANGSYSSIVLDRRDRTWALVGVVVGREGVIDDPSASL